VVALGAAFRAAFRAAIAAAIAAAATLVALPARALPSFDEVRAAHRPSDIPLLDRHGAPMQWVRIDPTRRRGPWVPLADTSPALREAIVLSEDRRFWAHGGVDWSALAASTWANAWNSRTRGASTVTMQLAGLLDDDLARPAGGRSVPTKLAQIVRAQQLEARWSKTQILEAYLNLVPLRGELVGLAAAAQQLFGKHASGLDTLEAAVLAVLVRAPNASPEAVSRRACELLRQQARPQADGCAGAATTAAQALARRPGPPLGEALAPHLARLMVRQMSRESTAAAAAGSAPHAAASPAALRSTLDADLQRFARAALRRQLAELRGRDVEDGAVIVLDNASGEVRAWVGSAGSASSAAAEVDAVLARRQPGSTLKPFVYALALERRLVTAASLIDDAPLQLAAGAAGLYKPQNYDHAYRGGVSVRDALAGSLNVPAVRVAAMLGPEALFERLQASGLRLAHDAAHHGHALALGSADVTLVDLANAYRMLANGGRLTPVRWAAAAPSAGAGSRQVFGPEAAWLVTHILADPAARAAAFGLDSPLVTRGHAAVKTGTSKDMRDNWCLGSTERFTVGVWVGNASGRPMRHVSGVSGAAPVWREVAARLHDAASVSRPPAAPSALVAVAGEWFIAGTEPAAGPADVASARAVSGAPGTSGAPMVASGKASRAAPFGIESPRDGTVIALDPEIPPGAQRVVFRGAAGQWFLDGRALGHGTRIEWQPRPGRHGLLRRDAASEDRVEFEVRTAPGPAPGASAKPLGARPPWPAAATPTPG
jgi:penicillin-binding protein 1C